MLAAGIIRMTKIGNQHHYKANTDCPMYADLVGLVKKTFGIADVIREALSPLDKKINLAFSYGSIAKGEETERSDIDLLLISESLAYAVLMFELANAEESLGRPVNPSIYKMEEIIAKLKENNSFLVRILKQPKLWIKGNEDDIRAIG